MNDVDTFPFSSVRKEKRKEKRDGGKKQNTPLKIKSEGPYKKRQTQNTHLREHDKGEFVKIRK